MLVEFVNGVTPVRALLALGRALHQLIPGLHLRPTICNSDAKKDTSDVASQNLPEKAKSCKQQAAHLAFSRIPVKQVQQAEHQLMRWLPCLILGSSSNLIQACHLGQICSQHPNAKSLKIEA